MGKRALSVVDDELFFDEDKLGVSINRFSIGRRFGMGPASTVEASYVRLGFNGGRPDVNAGFVAFVFHFK